MRTDQTIKNRYAVTAGVSTYDAQFPLYEAGDVAVYLSKDGGKTETLLTYSTHYTVSIASNNQSGTVTLKAAAGASAGDILALVSNLAYTQELDLSNVSTINTESTETQLDRIVQMTQQLKEVAGRSVAVSVTDSTTSAEQLRETILLGKAEAEKLLESQDAIDRLYQSVDNIDTVVENADDIDTVAGSIVNVNYVGLNIADVETVADNLTDVGIVADRIADVSAVAADRNNVSAVADDLTNIDTVAINISDVSTVSDNVHAVNVCSDNIEDISKISLIIEGIVPVVNGGTGVTTVADIQAGKDGNGDTISTTYAKNVNAVHKTGDEDISGEKKFHDMISLADQYDVRGICLTYNKILQHRASNNLTLANGTGENDPSFTIYGTLAENAGGFIAKAVDSDNSCSLIGKPDGTLTWGGQPIQTSSDERLKTPLLNVPDEVLDAWGMVGWGQFQFLDAVEKKGADKARLHLGLIAQRVKAVFEGRGLDACAYGILCHDERPASEDEQAVDLWMVRYTEALAMEAAYQRRRADMAEARIASLEQRMDELEAVLANLV